MRDVNQETLERDENKMIHLLHEDSMQDWVEFWSKGNEHKDRQNMEDWMSVFQGLKDVDNERVNIWKCGMRWAVDARRNLRGGEQEQWRQEERKQWRQG